MFKVKHSLVPVNISDLFNFKNAQYNLQNSEFELSRFETIKFGRNSIKYMGPLISSRLPLETRGRYYERNVSFLKSQQKVLSQGLDRSIRRRAH